jgi:hypothetical protein
MQTITDTIAHIDTTIFNVVVIDTNGNMDGKTRDTLRATIANPASGDSMTIALIETGDSTSQFVSTAPVSIVTSKTGANQIVMTAGDKIFVKYVDPTDPTDSSSAFLTSKADFPLALRGWLLDANGDGRADSAVVLYNKALIAAPDSLKFYFPDTSAVQVVKAGQGSMRVNGAMVFVSFRSPLRKIPRHFPGSRKAAAFRTLRSRTFLRKIFFPWPTASGQSSPARRLWSGRVRE